MEFNYFVIYKYSIKEILVIKIKKNITKKIIVRLKKINYQHYNICNNLLNLNIYALSPFLSSRDKILKIPGNK